MFLEARLVALSIYTLLLAVFALSLYYCKINRRKIVLFIYTVMLCIMGYYYVPPYGEDLYRLFIRMEAYQGISLVDLFYDIKTIKEPLTICLYMFVNYIGLKGLLPAIAVFIVFFFSFRILIKSSANCEGRVYFLIAFLLLMGRGFFGFTIGNIRTLIAVSISAYGLYKEFYDNQGLKNALVFYLIASMFHIMGVIVLISRLFYSIFENERRILFKFSKITLEIAVCLFVLFYFSDYLENIVLKFDHYTEVSSQGEGFFYIWEFIITVIYICFTFYLVYKSKTCNRNDISKSKKPELFKYENFMLYLSIINVLFYFIDYNMFFRFGFVLSVLNTAFYFRIVNVMTMNNCLTTKFNIKVMLFTFIFFLLEISRGNLCSLKFWE